MDSPRPTWEGLCEQEPYLLVIELAIRRTWLFTTMPNFYRDWSSVWKPIVAEYVGWFAKKRSIASEEAYDVAVDHLYDVYQERAYEQGIARENNE